MKLKLTDAACQRLKAKPGKRLDAFDSAYPGLSLRISGPSERNPEGTKIWTLFYRHGGVQKRLSLEPKYPATGLAAARKKAAAALEALSQGKDPAAQKAEAKAAQARGDDKIETVVANFIRLHLERKGRAASYIDDTRRTFDLHVLSRWRGRDIKSITRRDVIELVDDVAENGSSVSRDGKRVKLAGGPIDGWICQYAAPGQHILLCVVVGVECREIRGVPRIC